MEEDFYKSRLVDKYELEVIVPTTAEMTEVHRVIYEELCAGKIIASSKQTYAAVIKRMVSEGAEGVILGCTEIGLLVRQDDSSVPLFDTTEIHARAAVRYALEG